MRTLHDSTDSLTARQQVHQLARLRMEVLAHNLAAVLILGGAIWLAWYMARWYPLALLPVAGYMALKARFLADGLPKRDTPSWQRRLALWVADRLHRRRMARAARHVKPYRSMKVRDDTVIVPRHPGEMARVKERTIGFQTVEPGEKTVYQIALSDVLWIVTRAHAEGLSEKTRNEYGQPVWDFDRNKEIQMPNGKLSRGMFRAVQAWLVRQGFATCPPYRFAPDFRPEEVLERLNAL